MNRIIQAGSRRMRRRIAALLSASGAALLTLVLAACNMAGDAAPSAASPAISSSGPAIAIAKWYGNHTAAISITYDSNSYTAPEINRFVADQGLVLEDRKSVV